PPPVAFSPSSLVRGPAGECRAAVGSSSWSSHAALSTVGVMNTTRIAELRSLRGWTQERLAEVSGVTVRTIQRLEAGNEVSLNTLARIGEALEVPVRELFVTVPDGDYGRSLSALDLAEVEGFSRAASVAWRRIALAVGMFTASPVPVVLLIAVADVGVIPVSVEVAVAVGVGLFLLICAGAGLCLVRASSHMAPYSAVRRHRLGADPAAVQWVEHVKNAHARQRFASISLAVSVWVLSPLPLITAALLDPTPQQPLWIAAGAGFLLVAVAAGLFAVVRTASPAYVASKVARVG
ncbi:helix-turn-helix domain-containing protein, partial [Microbacterium enclense]|uniref:helix-turn-helix domain-containing protein n=1 Tax=Microbacterium enclense TaxID=993073 RepID=UPI001F0CBF58